ncbi:MAG: phage BR0599 family protein, partial [Pseudomonadota bacterium]
RQCDAVLGEERCGLSVNGRTCDRRFETCRDVFANTENFRGFPHLPGNDFILAGPAASGNDGGKR